MYNKPKKPTISLKTLSLQGIVLISTALLLQLILPWWIVAVLSFIIAFLFKNNLKSGFGISFTSIFLLWSVASMVADRSFDSSMALLLSKILGNIGPSYVFYITGAIGGFVAGLGGMMGAWTRQLAQK